MITCLYGTVPTIYFWPYFIFFSALIVTLRTDLETMLISRFMTLTLVPLGFGLSLLGYLPISWYESLTGSVLGYGILWTVAKLFKVVTSKDGLGEGDMELMALIGAFLGPLGCWITLLVGSLFGSIVGLMIQLITHRRLIPFGPFLALGAMTYVLLETQLLLLLF
ncbi:prepilin peptidase [Candidatus Babeliales bacterium]|nr:prepilin peptidase [Candidatus Babeliales bacterium]